MLVEAPENAPIFFLVGPRIPPGGGPPEEAGTVVWRQRIGFSGQVLDPREVLVVDDPFPDTDPAAPPPSKDPSGPFRFESEIAIHKPLLDVVIVGSHMAQLALPPPIVPVAYGSITITRPATGVFGPIPRNFDWLPRSEGPRLALAGDAENFEAGAQLLPDLYDNEFWNGNPVPGQGPLSHRDRIDFNPNAGSARSVTIPAPPRFEVTQDGAPLDPPLTLAPRVDTVVLDLAENAFVLIWRAAFSWESRFENATLEAFDA